MRIQDIKKEREHGRRIAQRAERVWGWSSHAGRERLVRRAALLIQLGRMDQGTRVLELGCGVGTLTSKLAMTKASITAIDVCEDLIVRAKREAKFPNVSFYLSDAHHLPFKEAVFDVVCGNSFLHHVGLEIVFDQIRYVLKKNGRIVFTEPNMLSPGVMIQKNIKPIKMLSGDTVDETAFFRWPLKCFLQKSGFVDVRIESFDFLPSLTPPAWISWIKRTGIILERLDRKSVV